jgi:branched-chain amino acid transport system substrate-binding protein
MGTSRRSWSVDRRTILKSSAAIAAVQFSSPFVIKVRGETPVRIGMVDPLTGVYAAIAQGEVVGAKFAAEEINRKGGILGRPVELLVEDSANDVGTGVQKTRKLIERDQASFIIGDVNSGIALAMAQVTSEKKVLHIVSGGHTDVLTGSGCSWNMFRVCNSTTMDANAIATTLIEKFGKKWYFLTPDYAYGHSVQAGFEKVLKAAGGKSAGSLVPLGTPDYSSYLIQAKAFGPQVLINVMGGGDQVASLKQFVQFGMDKDMAVGGALFELESIRAVPDGARVGWWTMEWWWDQPGVRMSPSSMPRSRRSRGPPPRRATGSATCRCRHWRWSPIRRKRSRRPNWRTRCPDSSCGRRSPCSRARRSIAPVTMS